MILYRLIFGKLLKISRLPRSSLGTNKPRNLLTNLTEFLLISIFLILANQNWQHLSLRFTQKFQFLNLFILKTEKFLLFYLLCLCFLEDALLVIFYEEFCELEVVDYWISFSTELVELDFMVELIFLIFVQEFELVDLWMTQILQPQLMNIIILEFP